MLSLMDLLTLSLALSESQLVCIIFLFFVLQFMCKRPSRSSHYVNHQNSSAFPHVFVKSATQSQTDWLSQSPLQLSRSWQKEAYSSKVARAHSLERFKSLKHHSELPQQSKCKLWRQDSRKYIQSLWKMSLWGNHIQNTFIQIWV